jgi:hypothetical protein
MANYSARSSDLSPSYIIILSYFPLPKLTSTKRRGTFSGSF